MCERVRLETVTRCHLDHEGIHLSSQDQACGACKWGAVCIAFTKISESSSRSLVKASFEAVGVIAAVAATGIAAFISSNSLRNCFPTALSDV